jgi:hypothetical protein
LLFTATIGKIDNAMIRTVIARPNAAATRMPQ